ncbi:hypothetical protein [Streptomyces thermolilacinus]|uniref:hypothetical protein n=1 Tax=Streptomyces thermolilacinus TaxID=285540 RepID=UPI0033EDF251
MKRPRRIPPILIGASLLAALSLIWSAYAITDLMNAGAFGVSVAIAGDIGWLTILWAEYRRITIAGRTWAAPAAGWTIAIGVAVLLALHGAEEGSSGQTFAGPFIVLVGKVVWAIALASLRDPAALTAEQEAEIHTVMRESEFTARLNAAERDRIDRQADAEIARIEAEARITLARDDVDFRITLERLEKRAQIERNSPLALTAGPVFAPTPITREQPNEQRANTPPSTPSTITPNTPMNRANADREQPSMAAIVREQLANTASTDEAITRVLAIIPNANRESVAAAVRRERRKNPMKGGYV